MLQTSPALIRVQIRKPTPETTWPLRCSGCGRLTDPRKVTLVDVNPSWSEEQLCPSCWKRIAA